MKSPRSKPGRLAVPSNGFISAIRKDREASNGARNADRRRSFDCVDPPNHNNVFKRNSTMTRCLLMKPHRLTQLALASALALTACGGGGGSSGPAAGGDVAAREGSSGARAVSPGDGKLTTQQVGSHITV